MDNLGRNSVELVDSDSLVAVVGARSSIGAGDRLVDDAADAEMELDSFVRLLPVVGPVLALPLRNTLPERIA